MKASTGRMNTRTTNRSRGPIALSIVGALALTSLAMTAGPRDEARGGDKGRGGQGRRQGDEPEKTLPPILQQALEEKEAQVTEARREAIRLHREPTCTRTRAARPASGQGAGRVPLQAGRALLGRVEGGLSREDGALSGGGVGLPQRPLGVPEGSAPPADHRSDARAGDLPAAHRPVPEVPQDRHRHLPLCLLAARPGEDRRVDQVLPDHPR